MVGATYPAEIERVRAIAPTLPLLIPGVGAQGGDAAATVRAGWRADAPSVVNSSSAILYASAGDDFAQAARAQAPATRADSPRHVPPDQSSAAQSSSRSTSLLSRRSSSFTSALSSTASIRSWRSTNCGSMAW